MRRLIERTKVWKPVTAGVVGPFPISARFMMKHVRKLAVGFVLAVSAFAVRADDAAEARAIIENAVKAHGGQATLEKFPANTARFKGTFHGMGEGIPMSGEVCSQAAEKLRVDVEVMVMGMKIRVISIFAGDKGWNKLADQEAAAMTKDELEEGRKQAHTAWVTTLIPLKDKNYTLATLGEIKVDGRPARGVKVSRKGQRDVDLYFDKETGLLVKTEAMVKLDGSDQEVLEEIVLSDYKEVQGTQQAMKFVVKREGKLYMEGTVSEIVLSEKLDPNLFDKP
jgi:hypothetical protein